MQELNALRCIEKLLDRRQESQNYRVRQQVASVVKMVELGEPLPHRLQNHREDEVYPLLHQQRALISYKHDQDSNSYCPFDTQCVAALVSFRLVRPVKLEHK